MAQPLIVGDRVYLRTLEQSDITEEYRGWLNDYEVTHYLEVGRFPVSIDEMRRWLEGFGDGNTAYALAIIDKPEDIHIGNVTLFDIDWTNLTGEVGIMIGRKDYWRKGYGTEALRLTLEYAFQNLGLRKVLGSPVADRGTSMEERVGYKVEGVLRQHVFIDGEYRDVIRLGAYRDDFLNLHQSEGQSQRPK